MCQPVQGVCSARHAGPGKAFDRTIDGVPDGYRPVDVREALKVLIRPWSPERGIREDGTGGTGDHELVMTIRAAAVAAGPPSSLP